MVDTLKGFLEFIIYTTESFSNDEITYEAMYNRNLHKSEGVDDYFCSYCNSKRKGKLKINTKPGNLKLVAQLPIMAEMTCLQCGHVTMFILYLKNGELDLVTISDYYAGVGTQNTPYPVKYYLDQAYRSKTSGAISASAAMYRSALEWLLHEQGYEKGMLAEKINKLIEDKENDKGPSWLNIIDIKFFLAIKDIGNGAMHTNKGDIEKQKHLDDKLIMIIDIVMTELLDKIYELPKRSETNLEILNQKSELFK